jgi:hypothetical protein
MIEVWDPYAAILPECFMKAHQFDSIVLNIVLKMQIKWHMNWRSILITQKTVVSWNGDPPKFIIPL